jgi:ATP-dependent Lhr-like helicase
VGEHFLLAGKRWQVESIEHDSRRVNVVRARGWKRPFFGGTGGDVHPFVLKKMRQILTSSQTYPYLDERATTVLQECRKQFHQAGLDQQSVLTSGNNILWFTWQGSAVCTTLTLAARAAGLKASWEEGLALRYERTSREDFEKHLQFLTSPELAGKIRAELNPVEAIRDRFDHLVDENLLLETFLHERLDLPGTAALAAAAAARETA